MSDAELIAFCAEYEAEARRTMENFRQGATEGQNSPGVVGSVLRSEAP